MAYHEGVAVRPGDIFEAISGVGEKKMFGGIAFMVNGHMSCGVVSDTLMVRVGPDQYELALERPFALEMDFTGRPMRGFGYVSPGGFASDESLKSRIETSLTYVLSLPSNIGLR